MYSVRKIKTKSGATAVQVVQYVGHRSIVAKHIGSGKDEVEVTILRHRAFEWIEEQTAQLSLFPAQKQKVLVVDRGECIGVAEQYLVLFCFQISHYQNNCNDLHSDQLSSGFFFCQLNILW